MIKKVAVIIAFIVSFISCQHDKTYNYDNHLTDKTKKVPRVRVVKNGNSYYLEREGKPYMIKGACGTSRIDLLKKTGGNSFIAYHYELSDSILSQADSLGLTVCIILDIGKPWLGADYKNKEFIKKQRDWVKDIVQKYKGHPSVLCWIIGNEVHLMWRNTLRLWREVNYLSKMIHSLDPDHPTSTVVAGYTSGSIVPLEIKFLVPDIDFISLTIYGGIDRLKRETRNFLWGIPGPYLISEWGGNAWWHLSNTEWGAVMEPSSTDNADNFYANYYNIFKKDTGKCIGGYVFYWGEKQERTHTMFSLIMDKKYSVQALEALMENWTRNKPINWCPRIDSLKMNGISDFYTNYLKKDENYLVEVYAHDPDKDSLYFKWEILEEGKYHKKYGGVAEDKPKRVTGNDTLRNYKPKFTITTPDWEGSYRLFIYIFDKNEHVATANIPFYTL